MHCSPTAPVLREGGGAYIFSQIRIILKTFRLVLVKRVFKKKPGDFFFVVVHLFLPHNIQIRLVKFSHMLLDASHNFTWGYFFTLDSFCLHIGPCSFIFIHEKNI